MLSPGGSLIHLCGVVCLALTSEGGDSGFAFFENLNVSSSFVFSGSRDAVGAGGDCNCVGSCASQTFGTVGPEGGKPMLWDACLLGQETVGNVHPDPTTLMLRGMHQWSVGMRVQRAGMLLEQ